MRCYKYSGSIVRACEGVSYKRKKVLILYAYQANVNDQYPNQYIKEKRTKCNKIRSNSNENYAMTHPPVLFDLL